jgi:hypothetical protein
MKTSKYKGPEPQWSGRKPAQLTNEIREFLANTPLDESTLVTDLDEYGTKVFAGRIKSEARKFGLRADVANHEKGFVVRLSARPVEAASDEPAESSEGEPSEGSEGEGSE